MLELSIDFDFISSLLNAAYVYAYCIDTSEFLLHKDWDWLFEPRMFKKIQAEALVSNFKITKFYVSLTIIIDLDPGEEAIPAQSGIVRYDQNGQNPGVYANPELGTRRRTPSCFSPPTLPSKTEKPTV